MECNVLFCTILTQIVFVFPLLRYSHSPEVLFKVTQNGWQIFKKLFRKTHFVA